MSDPDPETDESVAGFVARLKQILAAEPAQPRAMIYSLGLRKLDGSPEIQAFMEELRQQAVLDDRIKAFTASGVARAQLIWLLSVDRPTRQFFAELGHRSGAIHRIALREAQLPSQLSRERELGLVPGWQDRLHVVIAPWAVASDDGQTIDIEREITIFLAGRHLPWLWLARATVGAFTWYVDAIVTQLLGAVGGSWVNDLKPGDPVPFLHEPTDPPALDESYWDDPDVPRLSEDREFGPIRFLRGDTVRSARQRMQSHIAEIEAYLAEVETAAEPMGAFLDKRRQKVMRNVAWLFRHEVEGSSIAALARAEFAAGESDPGRRDEIVDKRRKDVSDGIAAARKLLADHPYPRPILTLAEYEAGRYGI